MDITPQDDTTKPISDDQELAKALAGVLPDEPEEPATVTNFSNNGLQFEETAVPVTVTSTPPVAEPQPQIDLSALNAPVTPAADASTMGPNPVTDELSGVKAEALDELRPLIEKLNLPPEEKFDTYLLLIRNTDDASLIPAAHVTAQAIVDETRKAQALLDIIKEINYLSAPQPATTQQ